MVKKTFKCEYYRLSETVDESNEALFDLEAWLTRIQEISLAERTYPYLEDTMRLEEFFFHQTYNMWFLRFMRHRVNDVPSLSTINGLSRFMDLGNDEFVSEDVTCLFDPSNNVMMIQKNYHSISSAGIESYFNQTTQENTTVHLRKIISTDSFVRARRANRNKKIIVRLADIQTLRDRGFLGNLRSSIGLMIQSLREIPSPYIEFTFSVGLDRNSEIDETEANNILIDIEQNPLLFDRAKIAIIEENETKQKMIDLFLDSPKDEIEFEIQGRNSPIRFDAIMDRMAQKYCAGEDRENRRAEINRYIV